MKKILHISKYYYPFSGGTEQIARDVVLALKGEYEQKVIAFNDGKEDKVDIVDGVEVTNNVIVAANSVVTKDVPDDCYALGTPAEIKKIRNI